MHRGELAAREHDLRAVVDIKGLPRALGPLLKALLDWGVKHGR